MDNSSSASELSSASLMTTLKLNVPASVGVPEILPSAESVKPAGKAPSEIENVPLAALIIV